MAVTIVAVAVALVLGLVANRYLRDRIVGEDAEATTAQALISPLETLAVLLLAFVIVVAAESYAAAQEAAQTEARMLDNLFEVAEYAPPAAAQQLQAGAVCYARAITAVELPALASGQLASAASVWSSGFREVFREIGPADPTFELLVGADKERSEARSARTAEATPAIPGVVYWFMVVTLAVTVAAFAFSLPRRKNGVELITLSVLAVLFTLSLLLIRDVDRPYDGFIAIGPDAMEITKADVTEDYIEAYGQGRLPCDEQGRRSSA